MSYVHDEPEEAVGNRCACGHEGIPGESCGQCYDCCTSSYCYCQEE